jgi:undecaprenyl-diphosphatase
LLSGLFELYQIRHDLGSENILPLAVATALAFVAGYLSIAFLLHYLRTHSTYLFVGYRIVVGVILITLMVAGVLQP